MSIRLIPACRENVAFFPTHYSFFPKAWPTLRKMGQGQFLWVSSLLTRCRAADFTGTLWSSWVQSLCVPYLFFSEECTQQNERCRTESVAMPGMVDGKQGQVRNVFYKNKHGNSHHGSPPSCDSLTKKQTKQNPPEEKKKKTQHKFG